MTQNQRVCYSFTINFYFYNKTYLSVYRFCLIPLPKQTKLKKKLMKKTPKETSKQQQNNLDMLVFIFFYNHISFFLQSPKRSKSDSSDWEKKVKYHRKRRNALVPAMVRKKN